MPRQPLVDKSDVPYEYQQLLGSIVDKELPEEYRYLESDELDINRMMIHNPELMGAFQNFVGEIWKSAGVSGYERELVSLTIIREFGVRYEWNQHVRVALIEGLSPEEIQEVSSGEYKRFTERQRALLNYARSYARREVDDTIHDTLLEHFDKSTVIGITMIANIYIMTCHFALALDLDPEVPFVGWNLENI